MKGQKKDKREPITKFVEVIVTIIFIQSLFQKSCKIFTLQYFVTDHLKHKTVN